MNVLKLVSIAKAYAALSKDPSTKVGAIIVDDDCNVLSEGFNGFPRGVSDLHTRYQDRPTKYQFTAHAELNAISQAARKGVKTLGGTLIVTALHPCNVCAGAIIQAGIKRVYAPINNANNRWDSATEVAKTMLAEAGVEVLPYE